MARNGRKENGSENITPAEEINEMTDDFSTDDFSFGDDEVTDTENAATEEEMNAAFADAAKDAEGTELGDAEKESDGEKPSEETPVAKEPEATKFDVDDSAINALADKIFENVDLSEQAAFMARQMSYGYLVPTLFSYNGYLDIVDELNRAHFSEKHDDIFARAAEVAEKNPTGLVDMALTEAKAAREAYEKAMAELSTHVKEELGIKPLSEDDRKSRETEATEKLKAIKNQRELVDHMKPSIPLISLVGEFIDKLPALPPVKEKSGTRKIAAAAGDVMRPRLGTKNNGGIWHGDKKFDQFTDAVRHLKSVLDMPSLTAKEVQQAWISASGKSTWQDIPDETPVMVTLTNGEKSAEIKIVKMPA